MRHFPIIVVAACIVTAALYAYKNNFFERPDEVRFFASDIANAISAKPMNASKCEEISLRDNNEYEFGIGTITFIKKAILPSGDHGDLQVYTARFESDDFESERTYIRGTKSHFENFPVALSEGHTYSFCYSVESERHTAINFPETIKSVEE